ncbi:MAG: UDP-N-acetylmuramate--L-alanine ligase [Gemmatimonadota bacterium]
MTVAEARLPVRSDLPAAGSAIHMIGVGGAGMRGLAGLLRHEGYRVSGADKNSLAASSDLAGVRLVAEADLDCVFGAALIVRSAAVPDEHPQMLAARQAGVPVLKRARALGALTNGSRLAAVAGTHGKTTVTAMLSLLCEAAGLDPSSMVGGRVGSWDAYARPGAGDLWVVEADEYDRSFLELDPHLAVVTSVEEEHMEQYETAEMLRACFEEFAARAEPRLGLLACADDAGSLSLAATSSRSRLYGFSPEADARVEVVGTAAGRQVCRLHTEGALLDFELAAPGLHNAQNAAAALEAARLLGADLGLARNALTDFRGVDRRLERLVEAGRIVVIDDYAHHPTEVAASLSAAAGAWPDHTLVTVFQPHLFTRTLRHAAEFAAALAASHRAFVLPIYPAREKPIPGVTERLISEPAQEHVRAATKQEIQEDLWDVCQAALSAGSPGVTVVFMGAGDVTDTAHEFAEQVGQHAVGD